jgi:acetoin utilization protein AcuB
MIIREVMTTRLVTVTPDDTLSHAVSLFRQYQFHHLPVVRPVSKQAEMLGAQRRARDSLPVLEGLLTSSDIDLAVAVETESSSDMLRQRWQERRIAEVMHRATIRVTPTTSVVAAVQLLVERGLNCLPVVEYDDAEHTEEPASPETRAVLAGLLTRSDLLLALARALGAYEPGMDLTIQLPGGDLAPLARLLLMAKELHIQVRSIIAAPLQGNVPRVAMVRLGTINPAPLLVRLHEQGGGIQFTFADLFVDGR